MIVFIGGTDYVPFNEVIDLQAGTTGFTYNVTIRSNPVTEPTETFNVIMFFVSGNILKVTQNTATIQIFDDDSKRFFNCLNIIYVKIMQQYIIDVL